MLDFATVYTVAFFAVNSGKKRMRDKMHPL